MSLSPSNYPESGPPSCPATKHVLYVEVVPSNCVKIEREDSESSCEEEDPLSTSDEPHRRKRRRRRDGINLRRKRAVVGYDCSRVKAERASEDSLPSSPDGSSSPVWSPKTKRSSSRTKRSIRDNSSSFRCNRSNCSFEAADINNLNSHKKVEHKGKKHFTCDQCAYGGATAADLRKHYRQHTGEIPYVCEIIGCGYTAKHNNSLAYHTKKYHPTGPPIKCDANETCIYTTYLRTALRHHKMIVHGAGKSLECNQCQYKCYLMADLRKHHRVHTGENPYHCDYQGCQYACKISSNLKKHKRIHTEEKPYTCNSCEFRTNFINSLKVHKRTHTNERPYCCSQCGYRCNHTSNLKKHVARLHPGIVYTIVRMPPLDDHAPEIPTMGNPQF